MGNINMGNNRNNTNETLGENATPPPVWDQHVWPGEDVLTGTKCYNCKEYGILDENNRIITPCVNCAEAEFLGGGKWKWYGRTCYGSWDGQSENTWGDVEWCIKSTPHANENSENEENTELYDGYASESSSSVENMDISNLCVECGVDMGPNNPRQLCGKTYCCNMLLNSKY